MAQRLAGPFTTTVDVLRAAAEQHADVEAFVDGDRRMTYGALDRAAGGVAAELARRGVGHGDVVCVMLPSSIDYAVCYHAAMRLGAVTSGVNPRLGRVEVDSIVRRTRPVVTVVDDDRPAPGGAGVVLARSELRPAHETADAVTPRALSADDVVAVVWTSGTTGEPKGAVFDHARLAAASDGIGVISAPGDRRLSSMPFAHVGFMARPWNDVVNVITTVIVPTPWSAATALRLLADERVTMAQGVPAQWALLLRHPDFATTDLSSLRLAGTGGASVPPAQVREMREKLGCPVVVRYTSTEASLGTGTSLDDPDDVVAGTVGRPNGGVELSIVDDAGHDVAPGEIGTVRFRSPAVMRGYWRDPERTREVLDADGWLTTGDLGRLDDHGNLVLVGRRREMYIRGGYNVYPSEVEGVLADHPAVDRVAVVGAPDDVLGEVGVAFVVACGAPPAPDDLRRWCRERLADYKAPDRVEVVGDLPLTSMSKVDKQRLAAMARDLAGAPR